MNALDRIVIRAVLRKHIEFDETLPHRFARIGAVRLYRPTSIGSDRWSVLFGHTASDHGLALGLGAHIAIKIALAWRATPHFIDKDAAP